MNTLEFSVVGFPSKDQKCELGEKNLFGTKRFVLIPERYNQLTDDAFLKLKFVRRLDFDPDGLGGSLAYIVQLVAGEPQVFL